MKHTCWIALTLWAATTGALDLSVRPESGGQLLIQAETTADCAELGSWRWREWAESGFGPWQGLAAGPQLRLARPERVLEVEFRIETEAGWRVGRCTIAGPKLEPAEDVASPPRRRAGKDAGALSGRLLYLDRKFDRNGYVGTRRLPLRWCELELRRAFDDSLLATGVTDADGFYSIALDLQVATDVRVEALSRIRRPGLALDVVNSSNQPQRLSLSVANGMQPGSSLDLGEMLLQSAGIESFNVLDTALDAIELLADPAFAGALPDSGSIPPLRYDAAAVMGQTSFDGSEILISSAASGDSDAWSDCLILAAMGSWAQSLYGRLQLRGALDPADSIVDARRAFGDGTAIAFAALVRQRRALLRLDADGLPADAAVQDFVDLPTAAPPGVPVGAEWWLDLELRQWNETPIETRGQRSAFNVACLSYELLDGSDMADGLVGDDDAFDEDGSRWFATAFAAMQALPLDEAISYEDLHFAWAASYGQLAELLALGVDAGGCALKVDADEPNDAPQLAAELSLWVQPALSAGGSVRLGELFLGDVDAVELCNPTDATQDVSAYRIVTRRNGFSTTSERTTILPAGTVIQPGRSLLVHEGPGPAPSPSDVFDASWNIPWRHDEDGACILQNAAAQAIDFVRWAGDGGADASATAVPAGTAFSGLLVAPEFAPSTLARDSLGSDGDLAADFSARRPTPRVPNASLSSARSIVPRTDLDYLRIAGSAGLSRIELHAFEARDDARPNLAWVDSLGQSLATSNAISALAGDGWLALGSVDSVQVRARLAQHAAAMTSAAWQIFAWLPASDHSLLAVTQLSALALQQDPLLDTVQLNWSNSGSYDSLRVLVDGALWGVIAGANQTLQLPVASGRHLLTLRPRSGGFTGAAASASVFVGATPCALENGVDDLAEIQAIEWLGFSAGGPPYSGANGLQDASGGQAYPVNDTATATLLLPIDLTSDAELRFFHHCHLVADGDLAHVELSRDDGSSWQTIASYDGSLHVGGGDVADWSDGVLEAEDWVQEQISLADFAGERVRLRFRRVSNASGTSLGWGIDEISFGSSHKGAWMDPAGSDVFGCGHRERPFESAAKAWTAVALGDTLHLSAGTHLTPSPVLLGSQLRSAIVPLQADRVVVGAGSQTVLDAQAADFGLAGELTAADSVHVSSLRVVGPLALRSDGGSLFARELDLRSFERGVELLTGTVQLDSCVMAVGDSAIVQRGGSLLLQHCTLADVEVGVAAESSAVALSIHASIFAYHELSFLRLAPQANTQLALSCNDFFAAPIPFFGLADPIGTDANVGDPVYFCARYFDDYRLPSGAVQLDLPGCGQIGAHGLGCSVPVGTEPAPVAKFRLEVRPNPFNPRAEILLVLAAAGEVEWAIFDARGRSVHRLPRSWQPAGERRWIWDGRDDAGRLVASGVYRLRVWSGGEVLQRSLVLIR